MFFLPIQQHSYFFGCKKVSESQDKITQASGRRPSEVSDLFNGKDPSLSDPERCQVVLRQLNEGGEFSRTVKCSPGSITVLPSGRQAKKYEAFRQALLGKTVENNVSIRLGSYNLHASEIHTVGNNEVVEPGTTVRDMLNRAGVNEESHEGLASAVGLTKMLDELTENLEPSVVTRLAITCAFCSRCRIVFVDAPFADVGMEWVPALANFMLQSVVSSNRIIIVTGIERMPRIWKSSPFVETAGVEVGTRDGDSQIVEETMGYLRKIRHLIGTAHSAEDTIFTYPQRIFRSRTPSSVGLRAEAIENPNCDFQEEMASPQVESGPAFDQIEQEELQVAVVHRSYPKMPRIDKSKKKEKAEAKQSASLTRVSKLHRLRNASTVRRLRGAISRRASDKAGLTGTSAYRVERERELRERRRELQIMLLAMIMAITVLLLLNWV